MKTFLYAAARWAAILLFAAVLVLAGAKNKVSGAKFDAVLDAVTKDADLSSMTEGDDNTIKRLYGLDPTEYENVALYWPTSNMDAQELLLVQLKDLSQQEAVKKAVESRLAAQKKSFDGYGVQQYALLTESSVTDVRGNYVLYVVHPDASTIDAAFLAALKG